uniref:alpha-1,2-Mannosidase n=1 Tax=Heterorhabditis bacteriophora TaxID=37862 RepID=A0A1I7XHR6_HETBA
MFYHAYNGYLDYAYPLDELKPISCVGVDTWGSFSLSLVDALDTLLVMGNATEFQRAVDLVLKSVRTDANVNVSVFETNIRVIGGLISAHMLGGRVQDTGMPFGTVNLKYGVQKTETAVTCTAEFGALSRLTGDPQYERVALRALDALWNTRSPIGLVGNHINVQTGQWTATDSGIGAGVDSYFEYLVKGALLFQRPSLMEQFNEFMSAINEHVRKEDWFMWVTMQKGTISLPIFQSLEAFWPGLLTMVGDVEDATRIMLQYSQTIRQYGFPPEFYNIPNSEVSDKRAAFPLRPEMAESLMYLYRATEDPQFLEIGAQLIDAIEHSAKTSCGYATINNVNEHSIEDRMESFFLAETTKYLYLLFDPSNFLHSDGTRARIIDTPNGECVIEGVSSLHLERIQFYINNFISLIIVYFSMYINIIITICSIKIKYKPFRSACVYNGLGITQAYESIPCSARRLWTCSGIFFRIFGDCFLDVEFYLSFYLKHIHYNYF